MTQDKSYNIYEIQDKKIWDNFVTSQKNHTFLHSWAWGEFNEALGDKIWRFGIIASRPARSLVGSPHLRLTFASSSPQKNLLAVMLVIRVRARRGDFLFVPHGPILAAGEKFSNFQFLIFQKLTEKLREIAKKESANFIRISPLLNDTTENRRLFKDLGFRSAPTHMHAETTWTLDLSKTEDEILTNMRKTTRNLIRRSAKEGVIIKSGTSEKDIETFNALYKETVIKHNFTPFSLSYLKNQVRTFGSADIKVFTAWHNNEPIASAIIVFYGNSAFYHHGASSAKHPKIPAAYLLQWEAIREARGRGHDFYNFWGIVDINEKIKAKNAKKHPWWGITLFKKGFGGFQTDYLHAQDLPLSWRYWLNYIVETARRIKRGL